MSKTVFWILSFTWGLIMTSLGLIIFIILRVSGFKPRKNQYGWAFEIGEEWGGVEFGPIHIVNQNPSQHILDHEFGHSIQNCYIGPFMIFISLASAVRYWYREYLVHIKKYNAVRYYFSLFANGEFFNNTVPKCPLVFLV